MKRFEPSYFRANRFVNINSQWYFQVRESTNLIGPFATKSQAVEASKTYLKFVSLKQREPDH